MNYVKLIFKDRLDAGWSIWFNNLNIDYPEEGGTLLYGNIEDISALYGLFDKIRNLGIEFVYLEYICRQ